MFLFGTPPSALRDSFFPFGKSQELLPLGSAYQGLESRLQVFSCEASILTEIKQVAVLLT